eukprot:TRINITY_DN44608_c0_g1_i1.p1 TRINITY_DN44608_c0_g1~~TRINITY_DN44608_c0_g1_i1.p1  ORF type:complete len:284 (+),score=38.56 TRINITY_DN44608_c0_g1_i1:43-894(+)
MTAGAQNGSQGSAQTCLMAGVISAGAVLGAVLAARACTGRAAEKAAAAAPCTADAHPTPAPRHQPSPSHPTSPARSQMASPTSSLALSVETTNTQYIEIDASAVTVWQYLADVRHLQTVHLPVYKVEVLEHSAGVTKDQGKLSVTRWKQYADWGGPRQVKKVEEILTTAVYNSKTGVGHIDSIRVRRCDEHGQNEFMHFSHRFLVVPLSERRCRLSEVEVLESNEMTIDAIRSNTCEKHVTLFANIKREVEAAEEDSFEQKQSDVAWSDTTISSMPPCSASAQ